MFDPVQLTHAQFRQTIAGRDEGRIEVDGTLQRAVGALQAGTIERLDFGQSAQE